MSQGQGESATSPRRLRGAERQRQALELRKAGASYPEIARTLGCALSSAHKAVSRALLRTLQEPADEVRKLELDRLDRLMRALWPAAIGTVEMPADMDAVDRVLKIMARRAAMQGLDAPMKIAPTNPAGDKPYAHQAIADPEAADLAHRLLQRLATGAAQPGGAGVGGEQQELDSLPAPLGAEPQAS